MRSVPFLMVLGSAVSVSRAQENWVFQNPLPTGSTLFGSHFPTPDTGYAVGRGGTILATTDALSVP